MAAVIMPEPDAAAAWLVEAGDAVEHRGLAGAVRADQRGDVAALRREAQVVDRNKAAEPHGQALDRQDGLGRGAHPCPCLRRESATALCSARCSDGSRVATSP